MTMLQDPPYYRTVASSYVRSNFNFPLRCYFCKKYSTTGIIYRQSYELPQLKTNLDNRMMTSPEANTEKPRKTTWPLQMASILGLPCCWFKCMHGGRVLEHARRTIGEAVACWSRNFERLRDSRENLVKFADFVTFFEVSCSAGVFSRFLSV